MSPVVVLPALLAGAVPALLWPPRPVAPVVAAAAATTRTRTTGEHGVAPLVAALGAGFTGWLLVGGRFGPVVAALAASGAWWWVSRLESPVERRRRQRLTHDLPLVVDLMAAALAAGLAPSAALELVVDVVEGPIHDDLAEPAKRLGLGVDPVTAWTDLGRHPQLGVLGRTVARALQSGAAVADALARLSDDLRRDLRARVESSARAVGVKAALPLGVCLLPAFVLLGVVPLVVGSVSAVLTH